jgi:hypothetical protein
MAASLGRASHTTAFLTRDTSAELRVACLRLRGRLETRDFQSYFVGLSAGTIKSGITMGFASKTSKPTTVRGVLELPRSW